MQQQNEVIQKLEKPSDALNIISEVSQKRPWVRFFARYIDVYIFSIFLGLIWHFFLPIPLPKSNIGFGLIVLFLWMFVESIFLSTAGTTFGKWILKIRLQHNNRAKITFSDALQRSFLVWLKGLAIGIPFVNLFTLVAAYSDLTKRGITSWDKKGGFAITHEKIGFIRVFIVFVLCLVFISLLIYGNLAETHQYTQ